MKVIKPGDGRKGFGVEIRCSGSGNGGGGCHAQLLVEENDLFHTYSSAMGDGTHYFTFKCPSCGVWTDIPNKRVSGWLQRKLQELPITKPSDTEVVTLGTDRSTL